MPIKDYPFTSIGCAQPRPMFWIRVTNPATQRGVIALAIVDTGADDCIFPAKVASQLSYKRKAVTPKNIETASGKVKVSMHKYIPRVDILERRADGMPGQKTLYTIRNTPINFITGCEAFLLGTRNFLSKICCYYRLPPASFLNS